MRKRIYPKIQNNSKYQSINHIPFLLYQEDKSSVIKLNESVRDSKICYSLGHLKENAINCSNSKYKI